MAEYGAGAGGGICAAIVGSLGYWCGLQRFGADAACCDHCCRCKCGWDEGEYVREDQEAARRYPKGAPGAAAGDEAAAPPAYKAQEPMVVPSAANEPPPPPLEAPSETPAPAPTTGAATDGATAAR